VSDGTGPIGISGAATIIWPIRVRAMGGSDPVMVMDEMDESASIRRATLVA
jgi:hypothetical protein